MRASDSAGVRCARALPAALALLAASLLLALASSGAAAAGSPVTIKTAGVSHIKGTTGELNGDVSSSIPVSVFFEYGPNGAPSPVPYPYASKTKPLAVTPPPSSAGKAKAIKVGQPVAGLLANYHYRIAATYVLNGVTHTVYGKDKKFSGGSSSKLKFDTTKTKGETLTATYGQPFDLTGSLAGNGNAGHALVLQETPFPYTEPFTTLPGTVFSTHTGSFVFKLARMTENMQFRVLTVDLRPLYSPAMTVHVTPNIKVHFRSAGKTGLYRIYGTVTPARNGAPLSVQKLLPRKAVSKRSGPSAHSIATTILRRATKSMSRFSIIVSLTGTFHYRVLVKLPKGKLDSGNSSNFLIKAPKAAPGASTKGNGKSKTK
ncbi:MAG TPA: hypothetical protein VNV44_07355 [Solirubrobacteraceae bacterium]|jgi:hypothetical protein|nr:hypothetical protein [Solirubrobacteraceae bacterium]